MPIFPVQNVGGVSPQNQGIGLVQNIQRTRNNELLNIGTQKKLDEFDLNAPVREAQRGATMDAAALQSITDGAMGAFPFIQAGDDAGLLNNLQQRRQSLIEAGRDPQHTDAALALLQSPDPQKQQEGKEYITAIATQGQPKAELGTADQQNFRQFEALGDGSTPDTTKSVETTQGLMSPAQVRWTQNKVNQGSAEDFGGVSMATNTLLGTATGFNSGQQPSVAPQSTPAINPQTAEAPPQATAQQFTPVEVPQAGAPIPTNQEFTPSVYTQANPDGAPLGAEFVARNQAIIAGNKQRAQNAANTANLTAEGAVKRSEGLRDSASHDIGMANYKSDNATNALEAINRALTNVEENPTLATGFFADFFLPSIGAGGQESDSGVLIPFSDLQDPARNLKLDLTTIRGVIAFAALNQMRANSPTGGALGQVSNFEIALLEAQAVAIDQRTSETSIKERLTLLKDHFGLIQETAKIESAYADQIMNGADPMAAQQQMMAEIKGVYTKFGRAPGEFVDGVYIGTDDTPLVSGESNQGKQEPLDLGRFEIIEEE